MRELDVLVSGSLWLKGGHEQSGWELIRCLQSVDPDICGIARQFLVEAGLRSVVLLQAAVASGELSGKLAADCMAKTLAGAGNAELPLA
jgi:predicted deacylase